MPIKSVTEFDTSHQPTRIQTERFNGVVDLPDNVDRSIRVLIKKYLKDIKKYCFLNSIYGAMDQDQLVERLRTFRVQNDQIPNRFTKTKDMDVDETEKIKAARRQALGLPEISTTVQRRGQDQINNSEIQTDDQIQGSSSLAEDLQDTIRDQIIPRTVYKRKL